MGAQIQRMIDLGVQPTHWDGHQNKHLYPPFFFAAMRVAKKRGILRLRTHRRYLFLQNATQRRRRLAAYLPLQSDASYHTSRRADDDPDGAAQRI